MPEIIEVFVKVEVNSQEEADRLMEASFSGLLSDLISMWLKHGTMFAMPAIIPQEVPQPAPQPAPPEAVKRDPEIQLQRVETEVGIRQATETEQVEEAPKPRGLAGRNRMRRS